MFLIADESISFAYGLAAQKNANKVCVSIQSDWMKNAGVFLTADESIHPSPCIPTIMFNISFTQLGNLKMPGEEQENMRRVA